MKRYIIFAAVAIVAMSCSRTYDVNPVGDGKPMGFGTWAENLTKAAMTDFAVGDKFDVFGYKWKGTEGSQTDATTTFDGIDVEKQSSGWVYAGVVNADNETQTMRYWDPSFAGYTFFAAYPNDILATAPAQTGLFVTNELTYDGETEQLLVAKKETVLNAAFGNTVNLTFMHSGALVDFQFKKHTDLEKSAVSVTAFSLAGIRTKGTYEVAEYNTSNEPVGATVSSIAGLGWTPDATPTVNTAAAPYVMASAATSAADATANVDLLTGLVVMPQKFETGTGAQAFTIEYTITDEGNQVSTFTPDPVELRMFDTTDVDTDTDNNATVAKWLPGYHYTYIITINAKGIEFSASIQNWATTDAIGHYYLLN